MVKYVQAKGHNKQQMRSWPPRSLFHEQQLRPPVVPEESIPWTCLGCCSQSRFCCSLRQTRTSSAPGTQESASANRKTDTTKTNAVNKPLSNRINKQWENKGWEVSIQRLCFITKMISIALLLETGTTLALSKEREDHQQHILDKHTP